MALGDDPPVCHDEQPRRADVIAHATLNGIDYVEVDPADHRLLRVFFLKPVPPANAANPADPQDAYGIHGDLARVTIAGGVRIVGIEPLSVVRQPDGHLDLLVSAGGDFSTYTLAIEVPALDPFLRRIDFSFMASCAVDFDCRPVEACPPAPLDEPALDYLAKDYASFRRLLLDRLPHLNPQFTERNPSDLGIALVELLAYTGDHLSYFQDAVANEAYLESVRRRVSARRHARLVDYRMHDGRNAWTWIHVNVSAAIGLPKSTRFVTRLFAPLAGETSIPGITLPLARVDAETLTTDPSLASAVVFETTHDVSFHPQNNEVRIHTWGNEECCQAPGAREAFLYTVSSVGVASRPVLQRGDWVLFEEVRGPGTGLPADADPLHRQAVRIEDEPEATEDPVYSDTLVGEALQRRVGAQPALPLLRVRWRREDTLAFPLCLSSHPPGRDRVRNVSLARGNLVLADHGITTAETVALAAPVPGDVSFRLPLSRGPLTVRCAPDPSDCDVRRARPAVTLQATFPAGTGPEEWTPVPDLLDSPSFEPHFVAEIGDDGRAVLRFGDGEYGREIAGATALGVEYRVGNGTTGNVGAEAIAHVALAGPGGSIVAIRNPLAARGGTDAETIEEVRRRAPQAFRAEQFRAVTEADYVAAARKLPEVAGAVATFRWTGSWYTVFVGVDPRDPADLVRRPKGLTRLSARLERRVRAFLTRYRLAGYDLEIRPPRFVPLEVEVELCVGADHFRGDVARAVTLALGNQILPDGSRGFFHPDHFTFGQAVYLSRLYAAIERVEGVDSAVVRTFRRQGQLDNGELLSGVLAIGPAEIALLDNDPSFMENGVLHIDCLGGKA